MKLPFGLQLARTKTLEKTVDEAVAKALSPPKGSWNIVYDYQAGAFEQGLEPLTDRQMTQQACVYSCVSLIANSIAKLPLDQIELIDGAWQKVPSQYDLLTRPSKIANRITWAFYAVACMLTRGQVVGLKRWESGKVRYIELLHPSTEVLVSEMGEVFYRLNANIYSHLPEPSRTIPARFIFHIPYNPLVHPLIGVPPLDAARAGAQSASAVMEKQALTHQKKPQVYGFLKIPTTLTDAQALAAKEAWKESNNENSSGIAVLRNGVDFEALQLTAKEAESAAAMNLANEEIARAFGVPKHLLGIGTIPSAANAEALMLDFYSRTLQPIAESIELALDEALELPSNVGVQFDVRGLSRLDSKGRAEAHQINLASGKIAVNEARADDGLPPVKGGEVPRVQMQDVPIDKPPDPPKEPEPDPEPDTDSEEDDPVLREQVLTIAKDVARVEERVALLMRDAGETPAEVAEQLATLKALASSMSAELQSLKAEREDERKKIQSIAESAIDELAEVDARYKAECEALRKDLTAAVESATANEKTVDALEPVVKSLETKNADLRKALDEALAVAKGLEKALSESEVGSAQVQESLRKDLQRVLKSGETLEQLAKDAETKADEAQSALQKALAEQGAKIETLEKALEESEGKLLDARMALKTLTERVEKAPAPRDEELAGKVGEIEAKLSAIGDQFKDCMRFEGGWEDRQYTKGATVTAKNSLWVAVRDTSGTPGEKDSGWKMCVKTGKQFVERQYGDR